MDPRTKRWHIALSQLPAGCWATDNIAADFQPIKQLVQPAHTSLDFEMWIQLAALFKTLVTSESDTSVIQKTTLPQNAMRLSKHILVKCTLLSSKFLTMYLQN